MLLAITLWKSDAKMITFWSFCNRIDMTSDWDSKKFLVENWRKLIFVINSIDLITSSFFPHLSNELFNLIWLVASGGFVGSSLKVVKESFFLFFLSQGEIWAWEGFSPSYLLGNFEPRQSSSSCNLRIVKNSNRARLRAKSFFCYYNFPLHR